MQTDDAPPRLVLVTGVSGAGHSTALKILEDHGFAAVDNMPLALVDPLIALEVETSGRQIAIGLDARTSGFSKTSLDTLTRNLRKRLGNHFRMVFVTAAHDDLMRRYNATRRQHPLGADQSLDAAISADMERMDDINAIADVHIDSTGIAPVDMRRLLLEQLKLATDTAMPVHIISFSYRYGLPNTADQIFDMRFAKNPHWDDELRAQTGLNKDVAAFIEADLVASDVLKHIKHILSETLVRMRHEGRPHVTIGFGCTGGRHRSVWGAQQIAEWVAEKGHPVELMHRELTRNQIKSKP
jgi:UPF0042 nucleotide-binding protein